jgi:hypothetical protein
MIEGTLIAESIRVGAELSGVRLTVRKISRAASGRVFRYPRGDSAGRAQAAAYGRSVGVPENQLDWPV